jgi:hypothetical protein
MGVATAVNFAQGIDVDVGIDLRRLMAAPAATLRARRIRSCPCRSAPFQASVAEHLTRLSGPPSGTSLRTIPARSGYHRLEFSAAHGHWLALVSICISDSKVIFKLAGLVRELGGVVDFQALKIGELPAQGGHFCKMRAGHECPVGLRLSQAHQE